jgi:NitT/TauT family transport system permease protein/sulfonate transport system permease protein
MSWPKRHAAQAIASHAVAEGLVVAALFAWWLTARGLPSYVLPPPTETARQLALLFVDPAFLGDTLISLVRVVAAVALAVAIGGGLAMLARFVPASSYAVHRRLMPVLNSFPAVAWALLTAFWFQPGNFSVITVEVLILIPFCAFAIAQGLADLDRDLVEMGRSFSRSPWSIAIKIVMPLLLPYIMSSVRIAYGIGWKIALVAELFGAQRGLGYLMLQAEVSSDTAMVFATCFAIVIIFVAGEKLVIDPLARRFVRY